MEEQIKQLQSQVANLEQERNILQNKLQKYEPKINENKKQKKDKIQKLFETYEKRRYALKLAYIGINYLGIEHQKNIDSTIEYHLYNAFKKTCLVENIEDMSLVGYSRSGRTDKGVSALGNVVALDLRTSIKKKNQQENNNQELQVNEQNNMDYIKMLNAVLPPDIRVLAQAEVHQDFNARFDCNYRKGAKNLIGEHDFRNFCKIDVTQTTNYVRNILDVYVEPLNKDTLEQGLDMYVITIKGTAFLWHQIRCIMQILFLIGEGKECPDIVTELFDIDKYPGRPQYKIASDLPLILYDCHYKDVEFQYDKNNVQRIYDHYRKILSDKMIESMLYKTSMEYLVKRPLYFDKNEKLPDNFNIKSQIYNEDRTVDESKKYLKLKDRQLCDTPDQAISKLKGKKLQLFNDKLEKIEKKRKLELVQNDE